MKKNMKRIAAVILAVLMITAVLPVTTFAAPRTIKLKKTSFTTTTSKADRKAASVKRGTFVVKLPSSGGGYLKFKAPKNGSYKFTFSNLTTNSSYSCGYAYLMTQTSTSNGKSISMNTVKTNGGKKSALYIASRRSSSDFIPTRYGKISVKKGQMIYIYLNFISGKTIKISIR